MLDKVNIGGIVGACIACLVMYLDAYHTHEVWYVVNLLKPYFVMLLVIATAYICGSSICLFRDKVK